MFELTVHLYTKQTAMDYTERDAVRGTKRQVSERKIINLQLEITAKARN